MLFILCKEDYLYKLGQETFKERKKSLVTSASKLVKELDSKKCCLAQPTRQDVGRS